MIQKKVYFHIPNKVRKMFAFLKFIYFAMERNEYHKIEQSSMIRSQYHLDKKIIANMHLNER